MEKLLTTKELAEQLNVPLTWIYARTWRKKLRVIKLGRYCMFDPKDIEKWIEELKGESTNDIS